MASENNFSGGALYVQLKTSNKFSIGLRGEYFEDHGVDILGNSVLVDENVVAITLSGNYKQGDLTIIPEFRMDTFSSNDAVILDLETNRTGGNLSSFVLAAVYSF